MARDAAAAASNAATTAGNNAAGYNSTASTISSNLTPYLTRQLTNPQGMSQRDVQNIITQKMAGAGGSTAGLYGAASAQAGRTNNPMGFSAALDASARAAQKGVASTGSDVASQNAQTKLSQQSQAASGLGSLYGSASGAGAQWGNVQAKDLETQVEAGKSGWLQNLTDVVSAVSGAASGASSVKKAWS
jgi:hypothetical protein